MEEEVNQTKETLTLEELEKNMFELIPDLKVALEKPAVKNPFISHLKMSSLDKLKMVLLFILVPIRLLCLFLLVVIAGLTGKILMLGYQEAQPPVPMTGIRKRGQDFIWLLARGVLFCCGFHNVPVKGELAGSKKAPVVVVGPHSSFVDGFILSVLGSFSAVSRMENEKAPIIGHAVRLILPVSVVRDVKDSRLKVVKEIKRRAKDGTWPPIIVFPEGTCTNREALVMFKPGAFYPAVPVQPIVIRFLDDLDYSSWTWQGLSVIRLLCIMTSRLNNRAEIEILPVYTPSEEEKTDAFLYSRNVRQLMANVLSIPVTDHSFEDCRLMSEAGKLGMPMESGLVEYYKLSPMIGMNCECMIEYLQKFAMIDKSRDGVIDMEEFCEYLCLPPTEEVKTIFRIYNIGKDHLIGFREYLLGFFLISRPFNTDQNITTAFELFESVEEDGYITLESYGEPLKRSMNLPDVYIKKLFQNMDKKNTGKINYDEFHASCLEKPEYALLFIHFRKLEQDESAMTVSRSELRRGSFISEFQLTLSKSLGLPEVAC